MLIREGWMLVFWEVVNFVCFDGYVFGVVGGEGECCLEFVI